MRICLVLLSVLAIQAGTTPPEQTEAIFKDTVKLMNEMRDLLKSVNDKVSAENAAPKLTLINERLTSLKKKELDTMRLPPDEYRQLFAKHKEPIDAAFKALGSEVARIASNREARARLTKELSVFEKKSNTMLLMKEFRASSARVQIQAIDKALQLYKRKKGVFPDTLVSLTEGKTPFLKSADLFDPWQSPYLYNPSGDLNGGKVPDVWTTTPDEVRIGNWEKPR